MNENLTTFLYELANFVAFALLLGWIFVKPIRKILDDQAAKDAKLEQTAQQHLAEAAELRQQLLDDRQSFKHEMAHQRDAMLSEAKQDAANMLQKANQIINSQREHLSREALQIQHQQMVDLAKIVADSSKQCVENLLKQIRGPSLEAALVEATCQQLKQIQPSGQETITVETAAELDEPTRQKIGQAAGVASFNGEIQFRVDPELLGGLRVKTSGGVIDSTIAALSAFAEENLVRQLNPTS